MDGVFYIVGSPIGHLGDMTDRSKKTLERVDIVACEDTRRTRKLLNHLQLHKPLKSIPHFREKQSLPGLLDDLKSGRSVAYVSDAGIPGLCDPGSHLVKGLRDQGIKIEVIGGVSALTYFLAGAGHAFDTFRFIGFLPHRLKDRRLLLEGSHEEPTIFFESPHRIQSTLELLRDVRPQWNLIMAKELSKISERFFIGNAETILKDISSYKGEWMGAWIL